MGEYILLCRKVIDSLLKTARENLLKDGYAAATLFFADMNGDKYVSPLKMPDTTAAKEAYFTSLGRQIKGKGIAVAEAAFLCESWYVAGPDNLAVMPSKHPNRREAIIISGRSAGNTRQIMAIQPFIRDMQNKPIWEPVVWMESDGTKDSFKQEGLLDYLFIGLGYATA